MSLSGTMLEKLVTGVKQKLLGNIEMSFDNWIVYLHVREKKKRPFLHVPLSTKIFCFPS